MPSRALCITGLLLLTAAPVVAQSDRPYTEGPVNAVSYIRVKPGQFDHYMAYLAGPYKQLMEAQKKAGIITGWAVYTSPERDDEDWNMVLTTTYKNMAALDNLDDRTDPIQKQVYGSLEKGNEGVVQRGEIRALVGSRLLRQLIIR